MNEDLKPTPKTDWWDELSESQKKHIDEGIDDIKNGREISSKEFWKKRKKDNQC